MRVYPAVCPPRTHRYQLVIIILPPTGYFVYSRRNSLHNSGFLGFSKHLKVSGRLASQQFSISRVLDLTRKQMAYQFGSFLMSGTGVTTFPSSSLALSISKSARMYEIAMSRLEFAKCIPGQRLEFS